MTLEERRIEDEDQIEYLQKWQEKQKIKKNKRKERINKIKKFLGGKR